MVLNHISEKLAFALIPAAGREVNLSQAKPFEHAAAGCDSRYQSRDSFPVLMPKFMLEILDALFVTVLGYDPHQNLDILFTPIFLDFLVLEHLLDSRGCEAHDGVITDVSTHYLTTAVELLAVGQNIASDLASSVFSQFRHEDAQPFLCLCKFLKPKHTLVSEWLLLRVSLLILRLRVLPHIFVIFHDAHCDSQFHQQLLQ